MELKSLILGLVFSVGIFAIKSGAGLSYLLQKEIGLARRFWAVCGFAASYALVFLLVWLVVNRVDLLAHLDTVMLLFKNGMTLHFLFAILLLAWGTTLLANRETVKKKRSRGWLLLALPCPVCFSVILFAGAFLHSLLPDTPLVLAWLLAGFVMVSVLSALGFAMLGKDNGEHGLGAVMVLVALYFLVTMAVVPQFSDLERIYRLSKSSITIMADNRMPVLVAGIIATFIASFVKTIWRPSWT